MKKDNRILFVVSSPTGPYDPPGVLYSLAEEISKQSEVIFISSNQDIRPFGITNFSETFNHIYKAITTEERTITIWQFLSLLPRRFGRTKIYNLFPKYFLLIYIWIRRLFHNKVVVFYTYSPKEDLLKNYIPYQFSIYDCLDVFTPDQFVNNANTIKKFDLVFAHNELLYKILIEINKNTKLTSHGVYKKLNVYNLTQRLDNSVVFAGGISNRIDYDLLKKVITKLKNINFYFVGKQYILKHYISQNDRINYLKWKTILNLPNVTFFSVGSDPESYSLVSLFKVAILPYVSEDCPNEYANQNVTPMKMLGYFANHVPIVSTPLKIMEYYASKGFPVYCARNHAEFSLKILDLIKASRNFDCNEKAITNFINSNLMQTKIKQIFKYTNRTIKK
jgi:hypothetical protein